MRHRFVVRAAVFTVAAMAVMTAVAQDKKAPTPAEMEEMTKKWQEASTPGAPHKALEMMAGEWASETKVWMAGPDAPPEVTKGSSSMKMVLGGRFLQQDMTGEMMGMKMVGLGLTGYDNIKKKYVASWVDNTSTALFTMEGTASADNMVITMEGKMDDPGTWERDKVINYVMKIVNKDKHIFEFHEVGKDGKAQKVMEVVYTRKK